jgi:hypothetical protein
MIQIENRPFVKLNCGLELERTPVDHDEIPEQRAAIPNGRSWEMGDCPYFCILASHRFPYRKTIGGNVNIIPEEKTVC